MISLPYFTSPFLLKRGFTLIELLVVIGIIGIMATVLISALNPQGSLSRANDSQRKSDLEQYKNLLQQYAIGHGGGFPGGAASAEVISAANLCSVGVLNLSGTQCLTDKRTGADCATYNYCYYGDNAAKSTSYVLFAKLENGAKPYWEVCSNGLSGLAPSAPGSSSDCKVGQ